MTEKNDVPLFAHLLQDQAPPKVKTGLKAGTGCDFTYTASGNVGVLTDINCTPQPWPPGGF